MIIEGAIAVKSALQNNKREVKTVYICKDKKTKDFNYIRKLTNTLGVERKELEKEELSSILNGKSH